MMREHSHGPTVWERRAALCKVQQENQHAELVDYKLLVEQREAHRRLRHQILSTVRSTICSIQEAPTQATLDQARGFFHAVLEAYQLLENALVRRQSLEMTTLGAGLRGNDQHALSQNHPLDCPPILAQARLCFPEIVYSLQY